MATTKWIGGALLAAGVACGVPPAYALVSIPTGTPDGAATDLLTVNGTYATPLVDPGTQPFATPIFTLSLIIPAQIQVSAAGPVLSEFGIPVSGSYTNNGQTEAFTNQLAFVGATNTGLATYPNNFSLTVRDLLVAGDSFDLQFQADGPLFSPTIFVFGQPETLAAGNYAVTTGSAGYTAPAIAADPGFTGAVSITARAVSAPEPISLDLFLTGLAGLWIFGRGGRTSVQGP